MDPSKGRSLSLTGGAYVPRTCDVRKSDLWATYDLRWRWAATGLVGGTDGRGREMDLPSVRSRRVKVTVPKEEGLYRWDWASPTQS